MNLRDLNEAVKRWDSHKNVFQVPAHDIQMFIEACRQLIEDNPEKLEHDEEMQYPEQDDCQ